MPQRSHFTQFINESRTEGRLIVQPRMGFCQAEQMRMALERTKDSGTHCIGTITIDSHTRLRDYASVLRYLAEDRDLNGYPIVHYARSTTQDMVEGLHGPGFPIQVRHGTPDPRDIFRRMVEVGLDATEGGPVSYCLPYGRVPLDQAISAWRSGCEQLARTPGCHLESFGGCMMGQLCPPSLLLALTLMECLFFRDAGIRSVSLSYAQGPSASQDRAALRVLRDLAAAFLVDIEWHVVVYTYMGLFPATDAGARRIIADSARIARDTGCERLIVKTTAERRQIPSVDENIEALRLAERAALAPPRRRPTSEEDGFYQQIREETERLVSATLEFHSDVGEAILQAFRHGVLDVPYCLHPDNAGRARAGIVDDGSLQWGEIGGLPFASRRERSFGALTSDGFLEQLGFVADRYDSGRTRPMGAEAEGVEA